MNTYKKGDNFENFIFQLFEQMLQKEELSFANPKSSRIFKQKRYYSRDRDSDIKIDVSIEVYHQGTNELALLIPVECKDYGTSISVGKIEEFLTKVSQIAGKNVKAVFVSSSSYASGAVKFAQSNNVALIRVIPNNQIEWVGYHALPDEIDKIIKKKYTKGEIFKAMQAEDYIAESIGVFGMFGTDWKIGDDVISSILR